MTAFGFLSFAIGMLIAAIFHQRYSDLSVMDYVAVILIAVGILAMVSGLTIWLYRVMP